MACRVARSFRDLIHRTLVSCSECGSTDAEMCYASNTLGPHLCPICAQSMVDRGVAMELSPGPGRCLVPS